MARTWVGVGGMGLWLGLGFGHASTDTFSLSDCLSLPPSLQKDPPNNSIVNSSIIRTPVESTHCIHMFVVCRRCVRVAGTQQLMRHAAGNHPTAATPAYRSVVHACPGSTYGSSSRLYSSTTTTADTNPPAVTAADALAMSRCTRLRKAVDEVRSQSPAHPARARRMGNTRTCRRVLGRRRETKRAWI